MSYPLITEILSGQDGSETTAARLLRYLADQGLDSTRLDGQMLLPLYGALSKSAYTAMQQPQLFEHPLPEAESVTDEVWGVIVETRRHPALEYVVNEFSAQLGIGIQLFHGQENESFIQQSSISGLVHQHRVALIPLRIDPFSPVDYNALLLSQSFWKAVRGRRKILVFQTDSMVCRNADYHLEDFLDFDYIGANWPRDRPIGMVMDGGNGGLSLRDWEMTVECLERFSAEAWPGGEDGFYAFHMEVLGGRIGSAADCSRFATQEEFLERSFGVHQASRLDPQALEKFCQFCPEALLLEQATRN